MRTDRLLEILKKVLEFEFEELQEGEDHKEWACEMFDIADEEYKEIFEPKKKICFMVEETGKDRHDLEPFTTRFGLYETLEDAFFRYNQEKEDVLKGDNFFMREEVENGDYEESETISSNGVKMPILSMSNDEEHYELYICEVEMN